MSETVTVTTPVSFKRWNVPNFATRATGPRSRQEGFQASDGVSVKELSPEALDALALAWLDDLYAKVGRDRPMVTFLAETQSEVSHD